MNSISDDRPFWLRALLGTLQWLPLPGKHTLYDVDGSVYMQRWNIIGHYKTDANGNDIEGERTLGSKILDRLTRGRMHAIRLHYIARDDGARHLHNHPFYFMSLILKGGYFEVLEGTTRYLGPGDWNDGGPDTFHRIGAVWHDTWSLFFMGPNSGEWGFKVDGQIVPSGTYLEQRYG